MRSGAVVRCSACENKYRIKSSNFEREIHTGPRTLDETDTVLRSDSVDIDPDEMPPVSIDDEGNVVGLSGLSELMRFSDSKGDNEATDVSSAINDKATREPQAPLPAGKTKGRKESSIIGTGRARAQAIKRKKRNKNYIMAGAAGGVLIVLVFVIMQLIGDGKTDVAEKEDTPIKPKDDTPNSVGPTDPSPSPAPNVDKPKETDEPKDPDLYEDPNKPEPNPDSRFVAPWLNADQATPPIDVPTMLTPAKPMTHEGWYVMNPPRGAADATGVSTVELGQLEAAELANGQTLLSSTITNSSAKAVMRGELHIMLLDSTGNVFAETYTPLALIAPRSRQPFVLTIPTRYWKRSRGVRTEVLVKAWQDTFTPMPDVRINPVSTGSAAALRISARHTGEKPLRSAIIRISATDDAGNALASFLVDENNLYIRKDHWLDLVLATPLPAGTQTANWSAVLMPK